MLNDEICNLRDKLNKSIEENASYDEIYKLSVELDQLIAKFYRIKPTNFWNLSWNVLNKKGKKCKKALAIFGIYSIIVFGCLKIGEGVMAWKHSLIAYL